MKTDKLQLAITIIRRAEDDLGELTDGQRRDLLKDQLPWDSDEIASIVTRARMKTREVDCLRVTWNCKDAREIISLDVYFVGMDNIMTALATALVESEVTWAEVTSYVIVCNKNCSVPLDARVIEVNRT